MSTATSRARASGGSRCAPCWRSSALQGAHLVVAGITLPNEGSVELHLRLGFERIGGFEAIGWKRGAWHGVDWFALELGPRPDEPAPLVPLPQIAGTAGLEAALAVRENA